MLKLISLVVSILSISASVAVAEQKKSPRPKTIPPVTQANIEPKVVSQLAALTLQLSRMEKMIADNHKLTTELRQQVAALTAQETAQQQKIADLQSRLQTVQNGVAGLTNSQAQMASNVLNSGQYVIDIWQRQYISCVHQMMAFNALHHSSAGAREMCTAGAWTLPNWEYMKVPFDSENFWLTSIPQHIIIKGAATPAPK
jgi:hypothetical protein